MCNKMIINSRKFICTQQTQSNDTEVLICKPQIKNNTDSMKYTAVFEQ